MILSILGVLFVFSVIVMVHEWGHMMAAKLNGVAVPEFAIGMGPKLAGFYWRGTLYKVCALPIGGFVRISGLEGDDALASTQAELERKAALEPAAGPSKTWKDINGFQKASILLAGPCMNFVLALLIVVAMGLVGFPNSAVLINGVVPEGPAAEAGLQAGDMIVSIDGERPVGSAQFKALIGGGRGRTMQLTVMRAEQELSVPVQPRVLPGFNAGNPSLGVSLGDVVDSTTEISLLQPNSLADKLDPPLKVGDNVVAVNGEPVTHGGSVMMALAGVDLATGQALNDDGNPLQPGERQPVMLTVQRGERSFDVEVPGDATMVSLGVNFRNKLQKLPLGASLQRSMQDAAGYMTAMIWGLQMLFTRTGAESVSGPVGIMRIIGDSTRSDVYTFLMVFMLINVNLGLINLMPVPALDGGRLLFVGINGLGIRINEKREALVHMVGMVLLLGFIALVSVRDVWGLATRYNRDRADQAAVEQQGQ